MPNANPVSADAPASRRRSACAVWVEAPAQARHLRREEPKGAMTTPSFQTLEEAFRYCRDMDAPLAERLEAFSAATRYLIPGYQEAADRIAAAID